MKLVNLLRDCPFCGTKEPSLERIELENKKFRYQITCSNLECQATISIPTSEEVHFAWNRYPVCDARDSIIYHLMTSLENYTEEEFYNADEDEGETVLFEVSKHSDFLRDFYKRGSDEDSLFLPGKRAKEAIEKATAQLREITESSKKSKIKSRRKKPKTPNFWIEEIPDKEDEDI